MRARIPTRTVFTHTLPVRCRAADVVSRGLSDIFHTYRYQGYLHFRQPEREQSTFPVIHKVDNVAIFVQFLNF